MALRQIEKGQFNMIIHPSNIYIWEQVNRCDVFIHTSDIYMCSQGTDKISSGSSKHRNTVNILRFRGSFPTDFAFLQ